MEFSEMYNNQKKFQELIMTTYNFTDREKFLKDLLIHLNSETFEVLGEINWKTHKRENKVIDEKKLLYEMVDVIKYALSLPGSWGFNAEEVQKAYQEKTKIVEQKFMQEVINKDFSEEDKVIGVDIDGVLLNYPEAFIEFIVKEYKTDKNIVEFKLKGYNLYNEFAEYIGIPKKELKELKHKYRKEGHKQNMKPIIGAAHFIDNIRRQGYKVVLLSARPVDEYPNLFYDTMVSLQRAGISFDGVYFSEDKEIEILKKFPNIEFFIEDHMGNAEKIAKMGKSVYIVNRSYNGEKSKSKKIIRVNHLHEILDKINKGENNGKN